MTGDADLLRRSADGFGKLGAIWEKPGHGSSWPS